jgi:hypothetical protein
MKFKTGPIAGQAFSVGPGEYFFIGSAETCAIRILDDPTISPTHACIYHDPSGLIRFKDMGSQYGTFRNGKRIGKSIELRPGDRITLGHTTTFQSSWWNALQVTHLTRFSMIRGMQPKVASQSAWYRRPEGVAGLIVLLALVGFLMNATFKGQTDQSATTLVVGDRDNSKHSVEAGKSLSDPDRGIFSGQLSAKLFSAKPKRVAQKTFQMTPERRFIWDEIVAISQRFGDPPPSAMDPGFVREVEKHLKRFLKGRGHKVLLERKAGFWPIIEKNLIANNMPTELGYIVWIESNFRLDAVSPVGAAGPWQFMPETAKEYGLEVSASRDQRVDLRLSTVAAAKYFSDLLRMFGTERYLLAIASYNTGQNRVKRKQIESTVIKERSSDFWQIRSALPTETAEYVPKFMAAVIIGRNPDRWNVSH